MREDRLMREMEAIFKPLVATLRSGELCDGSRV
jgi:hypothetical protein